MATEIVRSEALGTNLPPVDLTPEQIGRLLSYIGTAADTLKNFAMSAAQRAEGDAVTDLGVIQHLAERIGTLADGRFDGPHADWMLAASAVR